MQGDNPEHGSAKRQIADAADDLRERLEGAESVAEEAPVLSELFHRARTSRHHTRDGSYVGLFDLSEEGLKCRRVMWTQSGTHLRDSGADLKLSLSPKSFMSVEVFRQVISEDLREFSRVSRQRAAEEEERAERLGRSR